MKLNFKKSNKKIKSNKNGLFHLCMKDPYFDWIWILIIGLSCSVAFVIVGVVIFNQIDHGDFYTSKNISSVESKRFDMNLLENTISHYENRKAKGKALILQKDFHTDPFR
jgi:hypothetical protein